MKKFLFVYAFTAFLSATGFGQDKVIWQIGTQDRSCNEFALAPKGFKNFVARDFGFEDKYYLVGYSQEKKDFPYVLPGPVDSWGGTWWASGWRTNEINILFGIKDLPVDGNYTLMVHLADYAKKFLPLVKISINEKDTEMQLSAAGYDVNTQPSPKQDEPYVDSAALLGNLDNATYKTIKVPIGRHLLKQGGNCITITILQGSWIMFDQLELQGTAGTTIDKPEHVFVSSVQPASYELEAGKEKVQPLLVGTKYLDGTPHLEVRIDHKTIFKQTVDKTDAVLECPMPAVAAAVASRYEILEDGKILETGTVKRAPQKLQTPADYIDTRIGSAHSRWMIAPGPWMPFSMVKISPDNQNAGWQGGYDPIFESIGTFSQIHEWTMAGLGIFPTNGQLKTTVGDELKSGGSGYRSRIDKRSEEAPVGYYKALLTDYNIKAEITSTTRCSFERFTFPQDRDSARILLDFHIPAEYDYQLKEVKWKKVNDHRIEGVSHQFSGNVWSSDADQDYTLHFVMEFDKPVKDLGYWLNDTVRYGDGLDIKNIKNTGIFLQFDAHKNPVVQVRMGISVVSIDNAAENLDREITQPFGWSFDAVRQHQVDVWNDIFNRVKITTDNRDDKIRFYNSLYRSICSRNTWSDVNGQWRGTDGKVHQLQKADDVALGCDAFWNTFWNLNQVWNLITPEWANRWVNSQLAMYDANGWLAKGPAGMNYIPVMVAEHEIPQMVSAYQMGIRDFDVNKVLQAAIKMQTTPSQKIFAGYAGNRDLQPYERHHYVPADSGRFSNTMEYSFDDWSVGQLAKTLGKEDIYQKFNARGYWWKNAIDSNGYCHMKLSTGEWTKNFDPFRSGANAQYVEGNAWQMSYFVPQDVPALIRLTGARKFTDRLEWGFEKSEPWRYNGLNDQYWDCPVEQGNEQTMQFPFLFNWAAKPWLTQKWSRSILDRYYGTGTGNAYLGDEDQGQMSAWFVMAAMGLFQMDGGSAIHPVYEIGSPLFKKTVIDLGNRYGRGKTFMIIAENASHENMYVQKAMLNGKELKSFKFPAKALLEGGTLKLLMGGQPNTAWGVE